MGRAKQQTTAVVNSDRFARVFGTRRGSDREDENQAVVFARADAVDEFAGGLQNGICVRILGLSPAGAEKRIAGIKALRAASGSTATGLPGLSLREAKTISDRVYADHRAGGRRERFLTINVPDFRDLDVLKAGGWLVEIAQPANTLNAVVRIPTDHRQALVDFLDEHDGAIIR
jgi:hypothetical protein